MIPKNITKDHIIRAIAEVDRNGIPSGRNSKKYLLLSNGKLYPPKYIIALANKYPNREELDPEAFGGGKETNDFLKRLGFKIRELNSSPSQQPVPSRIIHRHALNPESGIDLNKSNRIQEYKLLDWTFLVEEDPDPSLARIVISGEWSGDVSNSRKLLHEVCDKWPKGKRVSCLVTCGAFLSFDWPMHLNNVGDNIFPDKKIIDLLQDEAEQQCNLLLDEKTRQELLCCTDVITIGIDSFKEKISLSDVSIRQPHIELVALVDLKSTKYYWTGKSYPTKGQEEGLVRTTKIPSHFVEMPFGKIMLLGCHDLNVFSPRGKAATKAEWRIKVRDKFYETAREQKPTIVLHHPHTTDSSRIWSVAWNELTSAVPSIKSYIGAGRYYRKEGVRSNIHEVLDKTKRGNTIDFIVKTKL